MHSAAHHWSRASGRRLSIGGASGGGPAGMNLRQCHSCHSACRDTQQPKYSTGPLPCHATLPQPSCPNAIRRALALHSAAAGWVLHTRLRLALPTTNHPDTLQNTQAHLNTATLAGLRWVCKRAPPQARRSIGRGPSVGARKLQASLQRPHQRLLQVRNSRTGGLSS